MSLCLRHAAASFRCLSFSQAGGPPKSTSGGDSLVTATGAIIAINVAAYMMQTQDPSFTTNYFNVRKRRALFVVVVVVAVCTNGNKLRHFLGSLLPSRLPRATAGCIVAAPNVLPARRLASSQGEGAPKRQK